MDSAEFTDWLAYYAIEPFGSKVDDERFGLLLTEVAAPWGGTRAPHEWFVRVPPQPAGGWRELMAHMGQFVAKPTTEGVGGGKDDDRVDGADPGRGP